MDEFTVCMVHPGTLPVTVYRLLAGALPPRIRLTVLQMRLLQEYRQAMSGGRADITVERLAQGLAAQLPGHGRRVLAGWSFGGLVALAIADLLDRSAPARQVVLLDTVASWREAGLAERAIRPDQALTWFCMLLGARVGMAFPVEPVRLHGTLDDALTHVSALGVERGVLPPDSTPAWLRGLFDGFIDGMRRNGRMAEAYRPKGMPSRLILVKPEGSLFPGDSSLGWRSVAGPGLRVVTCPGDHYSLLTNPAAVAHLATVFRSLTGDPACLADRATQPAMPQTVTVPSSDQQGRSS
jgi:thioesterase domain-containing protein